MKKNIPLLLVIAGLLASVLLSGCLNLKPVPDQIRYFVLTLVDAPELTGGISTNQVAIGIAPIILPAYLTKPWIVIRESDTEIRYSDFNKWAEYLDNGILRIQAQNLSRLLGTDSVALGTWRPDSVSCRIKLEISRFDVDANGKAVLEAHWQVSGTRTFEGHEVFEKTGPNPDKDPAGAVNILSELLGELSRTLAAEIQK